MRNGTKENQNHKGHERRNTFSYVLSEVLMVRLQHAYSGYAKKYTHSAFVSHSNPGQRMNNV